MGSNETKREETDMYPHPYGDESERQDESEYSAAVYGAADPIRGGGGKVRHNGWWVLVIILILAVGTIWLFSRYDFDLRRTDGGMTLVIRSAAANESPSPSEPLAPPVPTKETLPPQPLQPNASGSGPQLIVENPPGPAIPSTLTNDGLSLQEIYQKVLPSVVSITTTLRTGSSTGTGIIMTSDGYIITNAHLVDGAIGIEILTHDDRTYAAGLVGSDSTSDLAVLKVEAENLTPADFGSSDHLMVGDAVVAIGDPLGQKLRGTMTDGIISAINRDLIVNGRALTLIQTNAALNNGNSGGPLINTYGQVIGINTMKLSAFYSGSSATVEGLGFAIPITVAKPVVDELIEHGYVSGRPALGITGKTLPAVYRAYYHLPDGVYVETVDPSSDTYAKGLREGDTITAAQNNPVSTIEDLNLIKQQYQAGDVLILTVYRNGEFFDLEITLGEAVG